MNLPDRSNALEEPSVALRRKPRVGRTTAPSCPPPLDPWLQVQKGCPQLVQQPAQFELLLAQAGDWAEEITLCLSAPRAGSAALLGAPHLPRWSVKQPRIFLRHPESSDDVLLRHLHESALTSWVEGGGKQVASQLFLFVRGQQARVLFSHLPLERAAHGAPFGTLLCFSGDWDSDFLRACRAQIDSSARRSHLPMGSEVDRLLAPRRRRDNSEATKQVAGTEGLGEVWAAQIVSGEAALTHGLQRWLHALGTPAATGERSSASAGGLSDGTPIETPLGEGWALALRPAAGGFRLRLHKKNGKTFTLNLCTGEAWAAGNCLMLQDAEGSLQLVWRGGLLGHSSWKQELLWLETELRPFVLEDRGLHRLVAPIASDAQPIASQLVAFANELQRLATVFSADAPPSLGHALADFTSLSCRQQAQLAWSALLGLGALPTEQAVAVVAQTMRDQGSLRFEGDLPKPSLCEALSEVLTTEAQRSLRFDSPAPGQVRAIEPDVEAYVEDDWLQCALRALPQSGTVARGEALRLTFQYAQQHLGLFGPPPRAGGMIERSIDSALSCGVQRGLLARMGAGSLCRLIGQAPTGTELSVPHCFNAAHAASFASAWSHELAKLQPLQRLVVTSREGWSGRSESQQQLARRLALRFERAEQLEIEAWGGLEQSVLFREYLQQRLERALCAEPFIALTLLAKEDPWWRGVDAQLLALPKIFERLLDGKYHLVRLSGDTPGTTQPHELAISRTSPQDLGHDIQTRRPILLPLEEPNESEAQDPETPNALSEARLRLQDAVRSVFRIAHKPLPFRALLEGARQRIEVREEELRSALCEPPFVQLNTNTYGMLARDIPGGHEAIARALQTATDALHTRKRALTPEQIADLAERCFCSEGSALLLLCLLRSDPALHVSASGDVSLSAWQCVSLVEAGEPLRLALPPLSRERFEALAQADTPNREDALRRADYRLRCLEQEALAEDQLPLCDARDLVQRLGVLASSLKQKPRSWTERDETIANRLVHAAVSYFAEDGSPQDEDDIDRQPLVQPRQLAASRRVLEAVVAYLGCDRRGADPSVCHLG